MGESDSYFAPMSILDQENIQQSFSGDSRNSTEIHTYNAVSTALSTHENYNEN